MSVDNKSNGDDMGSMGVSEKKIVLRMIATFKRNKDMVGLRRFLGSKMRLDVQETEEAIVNIDDNLPAILYVTR